MALLREALFRGGFVCARNVPKARRRVDGVLNGGTYRTLGDIRQRDVSLRVCAGESSASWSTLHTMVKTAQLTTHADGFHFETKSVIVTDGYLELQWYVGNR